jgi:hypothetical protein
MREFLAGLLLTLASPAQAASLTLGCSGAVTTREIPKDSVAADPQKESVVDMSVVVDLDQRIVSGFWAELSGLHNPLPITVIDANSVTFKGQQKVGQTDAYIEGTVDRITGKVDAKETWIWRSGSTWIIWDLRCRPTKPLF